MTTTDTNVAAFPLRAATPTFDDEHLTGPTPAGATELSDCKTVWCWRIADQTPAPGQPFDVCIEKDGADFTVYLSTVGEPDEEGYRLVHTMAHARLRADELRELLAASPPRCPDL